jgi:hypothetical protein
MVWMLRVRFIATSAKPDGSLEIDKESSVGKG